MVKRYAAKANLPFGGTRGRVVVVTPYGNGATYMWEDNGQPCPYEPQRKDNEQFFTELVPTPEPVFKVGTKVMLTKPLHAIITKAAPRRGTPGGKFLLPMNVIFEVVGEEYVAKKPQTIVKYVYNEYRVDSKLLVEPTIYWFINSEGIVCQTIYGKHVSADSFRKKTGNFYCSADAANAALHELLHN